MGAAASGPASPPAAGGTARIGAVPPVSSAEFARLQQLMRTAAGIRLGDGKQNLVRARLSKRLRTLGLASIAQYLERLERDPGEIEHLVNALTTNVTAFFRERGHFELLAAEARGWLAEGRRRWRLWSCGCSMGHEAYSAAITLQRALAGDGGVDCRVLATDISTRALAWCRSAVYPETHLGGLAGDELRSCFEALGGGRFRVSAGPRRLVTTDWLNIAATPYPMRGPFDAIFCRNVMIYLEREVREAALREFARLLRPGGLLFIGHSESLAGIPAGFALLRPSTYRWVGATGDTRAEPTTARS